MLPIEDSRLCTGVMHRTGGVLLAACARCVRQDEVSKKYLAKLISPTDDSEKSTPVLE